MLTSSINPVLARSLEEASAALIESIRKAIRNFYAAPIAHRTAYHSGSTLNFWETRVLSNLENYHGNVQAALRAYRDGEIEPITIEGASYKGLSKAIDSDMNWALEQDRLAVDEALDRVVGVADQIHRLGNAELTRMGR
jgi:hypothetical protein